MSPRHVVTWVLSCVVVGCSAEEEEAGAGFEDRQLVADFADRVVVPTYGLLAARLETLRDAAAALRSSPGAAELGAAKAAWVDARVPWEQAEAFLFGPVDTFGYDPAIDSWPVDRTDLDAVLASGDAFSAEFVANLPETQKGFHTVEYLLFGTDNSKTAAELEGRQLEYLVAITIELDGVARALRDSWTVGGGGVAPYRDVLATAGEAGNSSYPSLTAAAQEILDGAIGICDEVANGKIADPYDAHDANLVESQFAFNSIADFQNNMRSVENVYLGAVPEAGTAGRGLSDHVRETDASLDARVRLQITEAIDAIGAIPPPFREAITTESSFAAVEAAQVAVRALQTTLQAEVAPAVLR